MSPAPRTPTVEIDVIIRKRAWIPGTSRESYWRGQGGARRAEVIEGVEGVEVIEERQCVRRRRVGFVAQRAVTALTQRTPRRGTETHSGTGTARAFFNSFRSLRFLSESLCHVSVSSVLNAVTARCGPGPAIGIPRRPRRPRRPRPPLPSIEAALAPRDRPRPRSPYRSGASGLAAGIPADREPARAPAARERRHLGGFAPRPTRQRFRAARERSRRSGRTRSRAEFLPQPARPR